MKANLMRRIDLYLGTFVCALLAVYDRVARHFRREPHHPPRQIVLLKFWGTGSILLTAPALQALRAAFPEAQLSFVTFASNRQVVELLDLVDEIHVLRAGSLVQFMGDTLCVVHRLRRGKVDAIIDFEFFSKFTMIFGYLTRAPIRVGFRFPTIYRGHLLTHPTYYNHYRHTAEIFLALARQLGTADVPAVHPHLSATAQARLAAQELLHSLGIDEHQPIAVINATVGEIGADKRRWPRHRFAELAQRLVEDLGLQVVLIGTEPDAEYVDDLIAEANVNGPLRSLAGKTDFACLAGLIEQAAVLVGCDSGPAHLAICLDTPTVTLFSTETPVLFGPTRGNHRVIYKDLYCSPCLTVYNSKIAECHYARRCITSITVDEVYQAVREVLAAAD